MHIMRQEKEFLERYRLLGIKNGAGRTIGLKSYAGVQDPPFKIKQIDIDFINYYAAKAERTWTLEAGLWQHILLPEDPECAKTFYREVSNVMLSTIDCIIDVREQIHTHKKTMIN